jgi:uncharacterized protein (TIGR02231 family)
MWKRVVPFFVVGAVAAVLMVLTRVVPADPPAAKEPPVAVAKAKAVKESPPVNGASAVKLASSRIAAVTVYSNSALVTREVDVPEGAGTIELTVTSLPPTTINSSLYTEGAEGIRVLTTRFRTRPIQQDTRDDVRKLQDELEQLDAAREKIDADIKAIQANTQLLTKLENFTATGAAHSTDKGALNSESAIAMSKYIMDCRAEKAKELVGLEQQIKSNQKKAEFAQRKLKELTAGPSENERDAVIIVEKTNGGAGVIRLNYLVNAASWRPEYKLRAGKTSKEPVQLEYLAAVAQQTGEDWTNVKLVLSTAQPALNAAPPELQTLLVTVTPRGAPPVAVAANMQDLEEQVKSLRSKAQRDFNQKKPSSGIGLYNTAAALDQSWELFNPEAAVKRGCALAPREGPTVTYHLPSRLAVPSRNDEQVLEVARIEMAPDYYYKAVPILTTQVYRLADLTNQSDLILLPGEATMYIGRDFMGQMNLPLVAVGETFTVGFGIDPQLQVQRQMVDKGRTMQGANQLLRYEYRILVSSYKNEKVKMQVWDRLPHAENEVIGVSLVKATPEVCTDAIYVREHRPNNLLRWDVEVDPKRNGEKALAIKYEFKLELDRAMTISSFQTAGVFGASAQPAPTIDSRAPDATKPMMHPEEAKVRAALAKLTPEDRAAAEAQWFCAIDQESPLGTMGPILKVVIKGQPVFLCCKGCLAEARAHPDETLAQFQQLMARRAKK